MNKKKSLEFAVHPLWKYLRENFGMEEAFKIFGPYKGAKIIPKIVDEFTFEVEMPLVLANTNYVGTHFGGSLYSMCDPFFMFILMHNLGDDYMVWDKSASINFLKPGRGLVKAIFHISKEEIDEIKTILSKEKKMSKFYETKVIDDDGTIVAEVKKELYIRKLTK